MSEETKPSTVSHYTTIAGVMGIVADKCLWASNASFLNDRLELIHGLNAARTAIEKLSSSRAVQKWAPTLERVVKELEDGKVPDTYVTCFCSDDDNLSQWRGYGGIAQGVCVTFDQARLSTRLKKERASLYKVTYARVSTPSKLRAALKGELSEMAEIGELLGTGSPEEEYKDLFQRVSRLLPKFKHFGFRDEREWRYVVQNPNAVLKYRPGRNRIVPFVELGKREGSLPIVSIRVGPGDDQTLTAQSLRSFLSRHSLKDVEVHLSDIPFRV